MTEPEQKDTPEGTASGNTENTPGQEIPRAGGAAPEPRISAVTAAAAVAAALLSVLGLIHLAASWKAAGIKGEIVQDKPLANVSFLEKTETASDIAVLRKRLIEASRTAHKVEITAEEAALLLAGAAFDLPAAPSRVGVSVNTVPPGRIEMHISIPLTTASETSYLNLQARVRVSGPAHISFDYLRAGGKDLIRELLIQDPFPSSETTGLFERWLSPHPSRIEILPGSILLDYTAP